MKWTGWLAAILMVLTGSSVFAAEKISKVSNPVEVRSEIQVDPDLSKEIEGLQWNRWTSKNFTVLALNDSQAQYLHLHLEQVKTWALTRWGFQDITFASECKLIVVDDPATFKKLFQLEATKVEIRRKEGKIESTVIFLLANTPPSKCVPIPVTQVCLAELAESKSTKFAIWSIRGMSLLNGTLDQIRDRIGEVNSLFIKDQPFFFSKSLLEMTKEEYAKLEPAKKREFDNSAMMFCLLVRKEFGQDKFLKLVADSSEPSLQKLLGFDGYAGFDRSFKRFIGDLTGEVKNGKTPDSYLQIR